MAAFVFLKISPCCLVLKLEIQKVYFPLNEATMANLQITKDCLNCGHFGMRCISTPIFQWQPSAFETVHFEKFP